MSFSKRKYYAQRTFPTGVLAASLLKAINRVYQNPTVRIDLTRDLLDGTTERAQDLGIEALQTVCNLKDDRVQITVWIDLGTPRTVFLSLESAEDMIEVGINTQAGDMLAPMFAAVEEELELEEVSSVSSDEFFESRIDAVEKELEQVRSQLVPTDRPLRCFLSYRFDGGVEGEIRELQSFLRMLGIEVLTGNFYEPRRVSDKIAEILAGDLDFVILVLSPAGSSTWTRDEISFAFGKGIPVVPIVERTVRFEPGIFGDQEYITFSAPHIGDAFVRLLEGIQYFRARRIARPRAQNE